MTETAAWRWWCAWCATAGVDPVSAGVSALVDAVLDARNAGWDDAALAVLVEAVGERTGSCDEPRWVTLRLALHV